MGCRTSRPEASVSAPGQSSPVAAPGKTLLAARRQPSKDDSDHCNASTAADATDATEGSIVGVAQAHANDGASDTAAGVVEERSAELVFNGVLAGFIGKDASIVASRVKVPTVTLGHFADAVAYLEVDSFVSKLRALRELAKATEALTPAFSGWEDNRRGLVVKQLAIATEQLKAPTEVMYSVGRELHVNRKEILGLSECAISDFQASQWESFGKDIGGILAELLSSPFETRRASASADVPSDDGVLIVEIGTSAQTVELIFNGVLGGLYGKEFANVTSFVTDTTGTLTFFRAAAAHFQQSTLLAHVEGLQDLADALESLMFAMEDAGVAPKDVNRLKSALAETSVQTEVVYHVGHALLVNGVDILGPVANAASDFKAERWEEFGRSVGRIAAALVGSPATSAADGACWSCWGTYP